VRHRGRLTTGTGIGLSIARAIVEGHGGEIVVRSAPGRGTTMDIVIPASTTRVATPRVREVTP
jgi:signal transduction histidine kinase